MFKHISKVDTFNVDDGDKWCDTPSILHKLEWRCINKQSMCELSIDFQKTGDNQHFQTFINSKDEILRTCMHFSLDFDDLGVIDYAIGFAKLLGLPDSDPAVVIAEKQNLDLHKCEEQLKLSKWVGKSRK